MIRTPAPHAGTAASRPPALSAGFGHWMPLREPPRKPLLSRPRQPIAVVMDAGVDIVQPVKIIQAVKI